MTQAFNNLISLDLSSLGKSLAGFDSKIAELSNKVMWLEVKQEEDKLAFGKYQKTLEKEFEKSFSRMISNDEKS